MSIVLLRKPISRHAVKKAQSRWRKGSSRMTLPLSIIQSIKGESDGQLISLSLWRISEYIVSVNSYDRGNL